MNLKSSYINGHIHFLEGKQSETRNQLEEDIRFGLTQKYKRIPSVYFYDEIGSQYFEHICELEEYYPTRSETEILERVSCNIVDAVGNQARIIELGSGSSTKTRLILEAFLKKNQACEYCPIDISLEILRESAIDLTSDYPNLKITAVAHRYEEGLNALHNHSPNPDLVLWLGSSVGNLERDEARKFLSNLRNQLSQKDRFLIGIDLRKEKDILENAYNDKQEVTAAFNLNVLERLNRELHAEFDISKFSHIAEYNEDAGRIEMYLKSEQKQDINIPGIDQSIRFNKDERILTEYSYKYSRSEIETLVAQSGFLLDQQWFDSNEYFSLNLLQPL